MQATGATSINYTIEEDTGGLVGGGGGGRRMVSVLEVGGLEDFIGRAEMEDRRFESVR